MPQSKHTPGFYRQSDHATIEYHIEAQKENIMPHFHDRLLEMVRAVVINNQDANTLIHSVRIGKNWPENAAYFRRARDGYQFKAFLKNKIFKVEKCNGKTV